MGLVNQPCKRPARTKASAKRKKPKLKDLLYAPKPDPQRWLFPVTPPACLPVTHYNFITVSLAMLIQMVCYVFLIVINRGADILYSAYYI